MKTSIESFIHAGQRLENPTDAAQRETLLTLLAEETAKAARLAENEADHTPPRNH